MAGAAVAALHFRASAFAREPQQRGDERCWQSVVIGSWPRALRRRLFLQAAWEAVAPAIASSVRWVVGAPAAVVDQAVLAPAVLAAAVPAAAAVPVAPAGQAVAAVPAVAQPVSTSCRIAPT